MESITLQGHISEEYAREVLGDVEYFSMIAFKQIDIKLTVEQNCRNILEDCGIEGAQSLTSGNLVGLANIISDYIRLKLLSLGITLPESKDGIPIDLPRCLDDSDDVIYRGTGKFPEAWNEAPQ